jgi:hypothetical protein
VVSVPGSARDPAGGSRPRITGPLNRRQGLIQVLNGLGSALCASAPVSIAHEPARGAEDVPQHPRLEGSFIQLWRRHFAWTRADWSALLQDIEALGLSTLIVQWSRYDALRFDHPLHGSGQPDSPLGRLARASIGRSVRLMMGLWHDPAWWRHPELQGPALRERLDRWVDGALDQARMLAPLVRAVPAFEGWYLTEEVDVRSWSPSARLHALGEALERLSTGLDRMMPGALLALSGFGDRRDSPEQGADFWSSLFDRVPRLDRLLLQDGIGVGHDDPSGWARRLRAVEQAFARSSRPAARARPELWAVVETFRQQSEAGAPFRARPATLPELVTQLDSAAFVTRRIAFSAPDYMVPSAGPLAARLYRDYRAHVGLID